MVQRIKSIVGRQSVRRTRFPSEGQFTSLIKQEMKDIENRLDAILQEVERATPEIMENALKPVLKKAIYYCPIDTGKLRESAFLETVKFRGNPRVEIGFGRGGKPFYAIYVHEALDHHHEAPTQAKFLTRAVFEDTAGIRQRLIEGYRELLNG